MVARRIALVKPASVVEEKITHALVIAAFSFFHVYNPPRKPRVSRA